MKRIAMIALSAAVLMGCGGEQAPAAVEAETGRGAAAFSQTGQDRRFDPAERDEIGEIVREYILANPEIIEEAIIELRARAREREIAAQAAAIERFAPAIYENANDPRLGPDEADIVIVEFMDYRCSYCRVAARWVDEVREQYPDQVQFIFKEYPVLGEQSEEAARAAMAALRQGEEVYEAFHMAMVGASGGLPSDRIDGLALASGVDVTRMREDMADPAIAAHIAEVRALGRQMGVTGTPFFIINGEVIPGANEMALDAALTRALEG